MSKGEACSNRLLTVIFLQIGPSCLPCRTQTMNTTGRTVARGAKVTTTGRRVRTAGVSRPGTPRAPRRVTPTRTTTPQVCSTTQFYSHHFSKSRIAVKKCVFNKRTIKVCVNCFCQCPGTCAPSATHLTLSLYICSSGSIAQVKSRAFEGSRVS